MRHLWPKRQKWIWTNIIISLRKECIHHKLVELIRTSRNVLSWNYQKWKLKQQKFGVPSQAPSREGSLLASCTESTTVPWKCSPFQGDGCTRLKKCVPKSQCSNSDSKWMCLQIKNTLIMPTLVNISVLAFIFCTSVLWV